jgi:hypothetical protein
VRLAGGEQPLERPMISSSGLPKCCTFSLDDLDGPHGRGHDIERVLDIAPTLVAPVWRRRQQVKGLADLPGAGHLGAK